MVRGNHLPSLDLEGGAIHVDERGNLAEQILAVRIHPDMYEHATRAK